MFKSLRLSVPVLLLLLCVWTYAQPPSRGATPQRTSSAIDNDSWIDANSILMFVSNYGALAHDFYAIFGRSDGLYFPYTGIADINNGTHDKSVLYQAGLWIGGKVGGQVRVTVSEFSSEFYPGPMDGDTYIEGADYNPEYRVYFLYRDSLAGNPGSDYLIWPIDQGAPYEVDGVDTVPAMLGDQMLWTVFNDAKTDEHMTDAGYTAPLGIEVRQTVWASDDPGEENAVYVKYLIFNKGGNTVQDCYISFWCDPDLGGASDDYVGCDSARDIAFVYNATSLDLRYGDRPPAVGVRLISGPVVPSPGDVAEFDGQPLADYRNLHMYSFIKIINGTDPDDAQESYYNMRGLDTFGGVILDPYTSQPTRFVCSGDPVAGTGWLDTDAADRRFMMSTGPFTFAAGDSQQVVYKLGVAQGEGRIQSVDEMKSLLDSTYSSTTPEVVAAESAIVKIEDAYSLRDVWFEPESQQWLGGINWGGSFFGRSADIGRRFFGSAIDPIYDPGLFSDVEVRFSPTITQRAYSYLRGAAPQSYAFQGYFEVPFQVWDTDHDRQLNAAFVENAFGSVCDSTWGPSDASELGGREYLFIFASDYSGDSEMDADPEYSSKNINTDAGTMDILYAMWPIVAEGHSIDELADGQKLVFDVQGLNTDPRPSVIYFEDAPVGEESRQDAVVQCISQGTSAVSIYTDDPDQYGVSLDAYHFQFDEERVVTISFQPLAEGLINATLYVADSVTGAVLTSVDLSGSGVGMASCCQGDRRGDVDCSHNDPLEIDSTDLGTLVNYLFSPPGSLVLCCPDEADVDGAGGPFPIDSTDLGTLVNFMFSPPGTVVIPACP